MLTLTLWLLAALPVSIGQAAPDPDVAVAGSDRPRIGLVLGGGGARGVAHVGVLKELERMRIPIDAIAGTSMGAIVGGLYASGMTPDELEELVASLDWAEALSDEPARSNLNFRRKQDDEQYPIDLEVGIRNGELALPRGFVQGQKLELLLRDLTFRASGITNFDQLPIRFRAVASDIARGEAYVIDHGDLAQAIRASMSVPGALAPVRFDGRLLVDGGLVGNLPVSVMQELDVDVIIAVDVEFPMYSEDELTSAVTISEQMLTMLIRRETLRQVDRLGDDDVLLRPELGLFGSANFAEVSKTIEPGAAAVRAEKTALERYSIDAASYTAWSAGRARPAPQPGTLAFVRVVHDGNLSQDALVAKLANQPGDVIVPSLLAADAERLHGMQVFETVGYRLVDEGGNTGVEFDARMKSWGRNVLRFGLALEDDFEGGTAFNLSTRLTSTGIGSYGAEWRTDLQIGTDPLLASEFYQPLGDRSGLFVAPRIVAEQTNLNAFVDDSAIATYRLSRGELGVDMGLELGNAGEIRIGAYRGAGHGRVKVGDPGIESLNFDAGGMLARARFDTRDNAQFPSSGIRADLSWNLSRPGFGADSSFDTVEGNFESTMSRGKTRLQLGLGYATTLESDSEIQDYFTLGGFLRLSGLERGEISGPHAAFGRLLLYRQVGTSAGGLFDAPTYLGVSVEAGNVWQSRSDIDIDSLKLGGGVFAGMETFLGPLYLGAGYTEGGNTNFYLFVGSPPR